MKYVAIWISGGCGFFALLSAAIGGTTHNMTLTWAALSIALLLGLAVFRLRGHRE